MNKINTVILSSSILIYIISLSQNCFCTSHCANSFLALIFGFFGIATGGLGNLCWIANPLLFMSWVVFYKDLKSSFIFSLFASLLSFLFLFATEVAVDEAGSPRKIQSLEIGYWLWLSSIFIIAIWNCIRYYVLDKSIKKPLFSLTSLY